MNQELHVSTANPDVLIVAIGSQTFDISVDPLLNR